MAVKIEVLDYVYGQFRGAEMLGSASKEFLSTANWTTGGSWTIDTTSPGSATHGQNGSLVDYLQYTDVTFVQGLTYQIKLQFYGRTQGNLILANHLANGANGFNNSQGATTITYTWVQGGSNTDKLSIAAMGGWNGTINWIHVSPISGVDWKNSIAGSLDVTDHSEFPLALTFQISDIKDVTASTGDYSKTFKIPATKNNNNILHGVYDAGVLNVSPTIEKPCRITINDLYSIVGTIIFKGVGLHGTEPDYYDCVYFGNNLGWAKGMGDKYMNEINWGSVAEGLRYNKTTIMDTWQYEDSDAAVTASAPPIVYPVVSYGDYNIDGDHQTIQLFDTKNDHFMRIGLNYGAASYSGYNNSNQPFGTPPQSDWRPAVFVKRTLEKIFSDVGYTISSNFMNTSMFKKLVWLLPNFKRGNESRSIFYDLNSFHSKFANGVAMSTNTLATGANNPVATVTDDGIQQIALSAIDEDNGDTFYDGSSREPLLLTATNLTVTMEDASTLDVSTGEITIGEYGYYVIEMSGLESKIARVYQATATEEGLTKIDSVVNIEVMTVGQTSWNIIAQSELEHLPKNVHGNATNTSTMPQYSDYRNQPQAVAGSSSTTDEPLFLNIGDKIRLTVGVKITDAENSNTNFLIWHFFKAGGNSSLQIRIAPITVDFGQLYSLNDVIEPQYKQLDFLKGISHAFNLRISTDIISKVVTIEPFNDFYLPYGSAIDWTSKLDRSKQTDDNWQQSNIKRSVVFKYKSDDKDEKVKQMGDAYFSEIQDMYPYTEELSDDFEKGETIFENPFFAGTYNARDYDTQGTYDSNPPYSACLWEFPSNAGSSRDDTPKGFDFQPRLLYWRKYSPTTTFDAKFVECQTWANGFNDTLIADDSVVIPTPPNAAGSGWLGGVYPQATSTNRHSVTSPVLSYGNIWQQAYYAATDTYGTHQVGKGLFDTYYKQMFEMAKINPRVRTTYIDLKVSDIINLDFRKLVYIDGYYWRVNRIIDFFPNKNQPTKVELIQWVETGTFAASSPRFRPNLAIPNFGSGFYGYTYNDIDDEGIPSFGD